MMEEVCVCVCVGGAFVVPAVHGVWQLQGQTRQRGDVPLRACTSGLQHSMRKVSFH